ncbi:hypothetical protein ABEB36_010998 [Hypothenemus hampei]|uniref:Uncharacterized protein n=1 Tax=Hypothenemus hampei TaxID=57062 RepID=A0ABD1EDU3_HYPHA
MRFKALRGDPWGSPYLWKHIPLGLLPNLWKMKLQYVISTFKLTSFSYNIYKFTLSYAALMSSVTANTISESVKAHLISVTKSPMAWEIPYPFRKPIIHDGNFLLNSSKCSMRSLIIDSTIFKTQEDSMIGRYDAMSEGSLLGFNTDLRLNRLQDSGILRSLIH